jgi:uncharacterized BrkB/YihY/UPF0761 family membrane protein
MPSPAAARQRRARAGQARLRSLPAQDPTYKAVYGAFAVLPVFLLWVYFSWLVTLAAALIAANLARR